MELKETKIITFFGNTSPLSSNFLNIVLFYAISYNCHNGENIKPLIEMVAYSETPIITFYSSMSIVFLTDDENFANDGSSLQY